MYINPSAQLEAAPCQNLYIPSHSFPAISCYIFKPKETTYNALFVRKTRPIYAATLCLARSNQSSVLFGPIVDPVNGSLVIARGAIIALELKRRRGASRDMLKVV